MTLNAEDRELLINNNLEKPLRTEWREIIMSLPISRRRKLNNR